MEKKTKSFLMLLLMLLALVMESTASVLTPDINEELWSDGEEDEEDELGGVDVHRQRGRGIPVNVDSFGAKGDGVADDTLAFRSAWRRACSTKNAVLLVPEGRRYRVNATRFKGPCQPNLIIQVSGVIVAPDEPKDWDPKSRRRWLAFSRLHGVRLQGGGLIDGSGSKWWAASCKINKSNPCKGAPTALTIDSSSAVTVRNLTIQFAQQMHFTVSRSEAVRVAGVRILAPGDSPNTDGIHISKSTNVAVQNCHIGTGDDCVSIVNASSNIRMKNIRCGPGHGISIGSLGKGNSAAMVTGVVLDTAALTGTTNGLRIKTWQGGSGYVRSVRFENVKMIDVNNPIIIDQFYCDSPATCRNQTSAVKISEVVYKNIRGTSRTRKAMTFACSNTVPCSSILLDNINLTTDEGTAETFCNCAEGFDHGAVQPKADCLRSTSCGGVQVQQGEQKSSTSDPMHTEL